MHPVIESGRRGWRWRCYTAKSCRRSTCSSLRRYACKTRCCFWGSTVSHTALALATTTATTHREHNNVQLVQHVIRPRIGPGHHGHGGSYLGVIFFIVHIRPCNLTPDVLIKFRWRDSRLAHSLSNLNVRGKDKLKQRIWTPLVDIVNYDTDSDPQDILETVQPDGTVVYSARLEVPSELCTMNLEKFPFDKQKCSLLLQSLLYNNTDLELLWEHVSPEELRSSLEFTQYSLASIRTTVTVSDHYEELADNYSQLKLYYELGRKLGVHTVAYYFLGFFMVVMSWGSFWLEPNEASGRVNIGIYPMMALIVQYLYSERLQPILLNIKEIWLLVCISFIVSSLMVSAVAHFISRQNKQFKLTLIPQVLRKLLSIVGSKLDKFEWNRGVDENERSTIGTANTVEHVMTSQEFALWMDRLSRVLFPVAFLLFNCIYWFYVYV
ncbi:pH-sensitive chloride channel 2-like isoform X1 [Adelges cooleyi]|uniref:pH-sensitive chloride channel 2-like isoform X1 n=1 Tax=Adelges cooleyi TaxID=133065 RepID=UPI0021803539|nr:pH-sensitive chloride channel 2-like isoform X1 [Adelges cooleyi]